MAVLPAPATLPLARTPGRYVVALVCLGNICRSPTAHVVLEARLQDADLGDVVEVVSSGTGGWHVGAPMDERAAATLTAAGYDATRHRARQFDTASWPGLDLVLTMDAANRAELARTGDDPDRLLLLRTFDSTDPGADVPDPYYGGTQGFEEVLAMVERSCGALVAAFLAQRPWAQHPRTPTSQVPR